MARSIERGIAGGLSIFARRAGLSKDEAREICASISPDEADIQQAGQHWGDVIVEYGQQWATTPLGALVIFYATRAPSLLAAAAEVRQVAAEKHQKRNETE